MAAAAPKSKPIEFALDGKYLRRLVKTVAVAASTDEARPILCDMLFTTTDDKLTLVATDSYMLSRIATTTSAPLGLHHRVGAAWLSHWAKSPHLGWKTEVAFADGRVTLTEGEQSASIKVAGGEQYPNFAQFLEPHAEGDPDAAFDPRRLEAVFKAAKLFNPDRSRGIVARWGLDRHKPVRFDLTVDEDELTMILMPVRNA